MKLFLQKILLLASIIFFFNFFLYSFSKEIYYKEYYQVPPKKFHSFLFSDSRGLSLGELPQKYGVYNFAAPSESYFDIYKKINFLIEHHYQIDTIYLSVDDHTLSQYREYTNNLDRSFIFEKRSFKREYFPILNPNIGALLKSYLKAQITTWNAKKHSISKEKRWDLIDVKAQLNEVLFRKTAQFPSKKSSQKLKETLHKIIAVCKQNHISLIGFKYPLTKIYLQNIGDRNYGADVIFKKNKLPVYNFSHIYLTKDQYFENQDHLNSIGGLHFSKIMFSITKKKRGLE